MKSKKTNILQVAVPTPLRRVFDYCAPEGMAQEHLRAGIRVRVPFHNRDLVGVLWGCAEESAVPVSKIKKATAILDSQPILPESMMALCHWAADYYHHPIGEVLEAALPVLLRQGKPAELVEEVYWYVTKLGSQVNPDEIKRGAKQVELLEWMRRFATGVSARQLKDAKVKSSMLHTLEKKGWISKNPEPLADCSITPDSAISSDLAMPPDLGMSSDLAISPDLAMSRTSIMSSSSAMLTNPVKSSDAPLSSRDLFAGPSAINNEPALDLNISQQHAVNAILQATDQFQIFLLDGVTGSGKTEVYLQTIAEVLKNQKQVLVLLPEIGLTPQTIDRFRKRFSVPVVALHSGLSDKERLNAWLKAKTHIPQIIIGTRSAVFTPLENLGLIVVDEEHDISFKQQDGFRYHARDLAIIRARDANIPIILGSATPSLESLSRAQLGKYIHLQLPERAGIASLPSFAVIDVRNQYLEEGLSPSLIALMQKHLARDEQVMLFLNRRGYAPVFMCHGCGWIATCKRCDARMTYHQGPPRLHCHHCDSRKPIHKKCERCQNTELQVVGLGTERLEDALQKHFPQYSVARIDRDTTQRKGSMEKLLDAIQEGRHHILVGTQMLAKGHHFPNVTLVGIVNADSGLFSADFRSIERMGQLILQVAGRAGRVEKPGTVVVQTHHPDHPLLQKLINEGYAEFAKELLDERKIAEMPPYSYLALFRAEANNANVALDFLQKIKELALANALSFPIYGPMLAPMAKRAGRSRAQLLMHATQRPQLQHFLKQLLSSVEKIPSKHQVRWSLDVDPLDMF